MHVNTNEELGKAIKNGEDTIEMEYESNPGKTTIRIKAAGNVAWAVCIAALTVSIVLIIATPATAGVSAPAAAVSSFIAAPIVAATLGSAATTGAIAIAVAGGGAGALNKLRKYKMERRDGKVILTKK